MERWRMAAGFLYEITPLVSVVKMGKAIKSNVFAKDEMFIGGV